MFELEFECLIFFQNLIYVIMSDKKAPNIQFVLTVHTSTGQVRQIATPRISDARSLQLSPWIGSGKKLFFFQSQVFHRRFW